MTVRVPGKNGLGRAGEAVTEISLVLREPIHFPWKRIEPRCKPLANLLEFF